MLLSDGRDVALACRKSRGQCPRHNMALGAPSCVGYLGKAPSAGKQRGTKTPKVCWLSWICIFHPRGSSWLCLHCDLQATYPHLSLLSFLLDDQLPFIETQSGMGIWQRPLNLWGSWQSNSTSPDPQGPLLFFFFLSLKIPSPFLKTSLLRFSSQTVKFTHLKSTTHQFLYICRFMQPFPPSKFKIFLSPQKETLYPVVTKLWETTIYFLFLWICLF